MSSGQQAHDPFFKPIGEHVEGENAHGPAGEGQEQKMVEEIESLCMECQQTGTTRLLLTYIPYFREVIIVSFRCEHCGNSNNEIQSAGVIQGERPLIRRAALEGVLDLRT